MKKGCTIKQNYVLKMLQQCHIVACNVHQYISGTSLKHVGNLECPTSFMLHMGCLICEVLGMFRESRCGVREMFKSQKHLNNIPANGYICW